MQNLLAGNRKGFGIRNVLVSICSLNSVVHSHLSGLWLHAGFVCVCVCACVCVCGEQKRWNTSYPLAHPLGRHIMYILYISMCFFLLPGKSPQLFEVKT